MNKKNEIKKLQKKYRYYINRAIVNADDEFSYAYYCGISTGISKSLKTIKQLNGATDERSVLIDFVHWLYKESQHDTLIHNSTVDMYLKSINSERIES